MSALSSALTRLICALAPGFVARGGGTIANVASVLGVTPEILDVVFPRRRLWQGDTAAQPKLIANLSLRFPAARCWAGADT